MTRTIYSLFLLGLVSLFFSAHALHLQCDTGKSDVYIYDSVVNAFGGSNEESAENKEEFSITATVAITCLKRFLVQGSQAEYAHLNVFNIKHAQVRMQAGEQWDFSTEEGAEKVENPHAALVHEMEEKLLEGDTYFVQSENGKIMKVVYPEEEDAIITNLKKSIIQELQTKVKGDSRIEENTEGIVKGHYTRAQGDDGVVFLQKISNSEDVKEDAFADIDNNEHISKKEYSQEAIVALTPDGRVMEAISEKTISFGKEGGEKYDTFSGLKDKINYEDGQRAPDIDGYFSGKTKSVLQFVEQIDLGDALKDIDLVSIDAEEILGDHSDEIELPDEDDFSEEDFSRVKTRHAHHLKSSSLMAGEDLRQSLQNIYKEKLHTSVDLSALLKRLHNHQKDVSRKIKESGEDDASAEYSSENISLVAEAQHYCKYLPSECLKVTKEYFKQIDPRSDDDLSISHVLQSIMVSTQSEEGQEALLESMLSAHLVRHAILRTLELKKPAPSLVKKMRELAEGNGIPEDADEDEKTLIRDNAYMAWADIANRLNPDNAIEIVESIMGRMKESEDEDELVMHVHALGNAGKAVPVEVVSELIQSEKVGDLAREAAIDALRRVGTPGSNRQITKILHNIIQDPREHFLLKKKAVSTLANRMKSKPVKKFRKSSDEDSIEDEDTTTLSLKFLERFLFDHSSDPTLKKAILELYFEEGSDLAARIVENYFSDIDSPLHDQDELYEEFAVVFDEDSDLGLGRTIRRIVRRVTRVVRNVIDGAKAIAQLPGKIANVVSSFKNVFKTATFKGNKICKVVAADGSKMCVYDVDMASFIQRQGNLSGMKFSKHFTFEKLLGSEALHAYVGGVGYAGATVSCSQSQLAVSVFGRVSAYTKILNKRTELLAGELELNKLVNQAVRDRVYLKVFGSVIVNKSIIPDNVKKFINECSSKRMALITKDYPNLVSFEIIIPIVIPFSIRVGVAAKFGIDFSYNICPSQLKVNAGIEPYFGIGVTGGAGITVFVAKGHVNLTARMDYRLRPNIGIENCQLCAKLDHETNPLVIAIGGSLQFLTFKWNKNFFEWKSNAVKGNLYSYCLNIRPKDDDDMRWRAYKMTPNLQLLSEFYSSGDVDEYIYAN